jgi:predicted DNA-binding ArsR family transcriptional regulator
MRYILTESQYNRIIESKKHIQTFQDLIDRKMEYIRRVCDMGAEDYEGDVGDESCKQIDQVENVKVIDADWVTIKHSNRPQEEKYMHVKIMIYYTSNSQYGNFDADDLAYDLEQMIRKSTGMPFILNYESTNTNKHFDW